MNLAELIDELRTGRLNDFRAPFLWSDAVLLRYFNQAEREACERARLIEEDAERVQIVTLTNDGLGVATAFAPNHGLPDQDTVAIEGAIETDYNVSATITVIDDDHWTYTVANTPASPATGVPIMATGSHAALVNFHGTANRVNYPLDPRIFEIRSGLWGRRFDSNSARWIDGHSIAPISRSRLEDGALRPDEPWLWDFGRDWKAVTGTPRFYLAPQERYLRLVPIATVAADIALSAYRYPMAPMALPPLTVDSGPPVTTIYDPSSTSYTIGDAATLVATLAANTDYVLPSPEIVDKHHFYLLHWVEHLCYGRHDSDTFDGKRAQEADAQFTAIFGQKIDHNVQRKQREHRSHQVRMNPEW